MIEVWHGQHWMFRNVPSYFTQIYNASLVFVLFGYFFPESLIFILS